MIINYVSGNCGSGKTQKAIEYAVKNSIKQKNNFIFFQPTKDLNDETKIRILDYNKRANVQIINSNTHPNPGETIKAIIEFSKNNINNGSILLCTHWAMLHLPYFHAKDKWTVIVDEIPQIDTSFHINLPISWDKYQFSNILNFRDTENKKYQLVSVADKKLVDEYAENKKDDTLVRIMTEFFNNLTSEHIDTYKLNSDAQQCHFFHILNPSVLDKWKDVYILGANFCNSTLYHIWKSKGVEFRTSENIISNTDVYDNIGKRLKIHYLIERNWSKKLRCQLGGIEKLESSISHFVGNDAYLLCCNKDDENNVLLSENKCFANKQLVSSKCFGINKYKDYKKVVFLPALNPQASHYSFCNEMFGVDEEKLRIANQYETCHQFIMRTNLRCFDSDAPVSALVMEKSTALWLQSIFAGSEIEQIPHTISGLDISLISAPKSVGRPKLETAKSSQERKENMI